MVDRVVLSVAKGAILERIYAKNYLDKFKIILANKFLENRGASFVTIHKNHNLRGCIGSIIAHRKLYDDIYSNATSAAFNDPRFESIITAELSDLIIEVSILSDTIKLNYHNYDDLIQKITPHKDGVILKCGAYQSTFLPQVWEQLPDSKQFLENLAYKAGLNATIYVNNPDIFIYNISAIQDRFKDITI